MTSQIRQYLSLNKILLLGPIFLLTSCFYSGTYRATYTVQDRDMGKSAKEISIEFINQLAKTNSLGRDTKYNGVDTLGFYGRPYHYFKFWFEKRDNTTIVKLDYWGNFGSRKNKPYKDLFNELNLFMKENFIIIEQQIMEEDNSKAK